MKIVKLVSLVLFGLIFIAGGINHFLKPDFYVNIMPAYLPFHLELVYVSGVIEFLLGAALYVPKTRRYAAFGIIALLVAVFPANLNMYLHPENFPDVTPAMLLIRLPVQGLLILWAWSFTRKS